MKILYCIWDVVLQVDALFGLGIAAVFPSLKKIGVGFTCVLGGAGMMTTKDSDFNSYWNVAFQKFRDSGKFRKLCEELDAEHSKFNTVSYNVSMSYITN